MSIRRGLVVLSAISLLLAPGMGGLTALFEGEAVCACGMGPDCPMCAARREHLRPGSAETGGAECRCRLTVPSDRSGSRQLPSLQPEAACLTGDSPPFAARIGFLPPSPQLAPSAPAPEMLRRPPRSAA